MATPAVPPVPQTSPKVRIQSIDLVRGLDVWLMLFVNAMAGVQGAPAWILHRPADVDGMTITDVVFPGFLFIVGLALPLAVSGRQRRGEPVWRHIAARTAALLVMGLFMVNAEEAMASGGVWPHLWNVLAMVALLFIWRMPPSAADGKGPDLYRLAGIGMLLTLGVVYHREGATSLIHLRPSWWGILGLIGWAYLVAASVYLLAHGREAVIVAAIALLYVVTLADGADRVGALTAVRPLLPVGSALAAHGAVTLSGALLGLMLMRHRALGPASSPYRMAAVGATHAVVLAAAGLLLHTLADLSPIFWFSKIKATVPWCLLSSAWTAAAWTVLYLIADAWGFKRWPRAVAPASENALPIYLVAPLLLSLCALGVPLFGLDPMEALAGNVWTGIARALGFAALVVALCARLRRGGLRIQL